jgi:hypothetical protein
LAAPQPPRYIVPFMERHFHLGAGRKQELFNLPGMRSAGRRISNA